jgi:zinc transporter 1/2/3
VDDSQAYLIETEGNVNHSFPPDRSASLVIETEEYKEPVKKQAKCNCTPYVLMIALSVHACFEGIALGLCPDFRSALSIMIAILIHKGAAGSALGISLVKTFPNDFGTVRKLIFIFAFATPLGIMIGILASDAGPLADVIMSSLAAGTFVYIACTEIVVSEFSTGGYRLAKLIAFIIGACIISSLSFIPGS